jgi:hypothetical protein
MTVLIVGFMLGIRDPPPPDGLIDLMWIVIVLLPTNCFSKTGNYSRVQSGRSQQLSVIVSNSAILGTGNIAGIVPQAGEHSAGPVRRGNGGSGRRPLGNFIQTRLSVASGTYELAQVRLARAERRIGQPSAKELVSEPDTVGIDDIGLAAGV